MKIAMIGHKRIPSREGGVEIVVENLSTQMAGKGHQVDVYNRKGHHVADKSIGMEVENLKNYKGVRICTIPTINKKSFDALVYSFLGSIRALFGKYDIIHYHAEGPCVMLLIPHLFGKKTIATIHGLDWQRAKWGGFATKYLKFGEKIAAKYADEVIVLSKNVQKYFKETYQRDTKYIPNGVIVPQLVEVEEIHYRYDLKKDKYILFLARIVPEKGLHYLLEAFAQIDTDVKLVIAGGASHSSEYVEKIEEMAKKDERVIMTGFVQGRILEELFSNCLIYVLPSDIEGMPISLLEALSYGCTCLVSDIDENVEVIGEYGVSFQKGNVDDLKEKLNGMLINQVSEKKVFPKEIREKYDWKRITEEYLQVYESIRRKR